MQQEMQPQYPLLYSLQGYNYCELLLESPVLKKGSGVICAKHPKGRSGK